MIIQKATYRMREVRKATLDEHYLNRLNVILLDEEASLHYSTDPERYHADVEQLLKPVRDELSTGVRVLQRYRRRGLKRVMLRISSELVGETRYRLSYAFKFFGFVDEEIRALESPRWWLRAKACRNLSIMQAQEAMDPLTALLTDADEDVKVEATQALIDIAGAMAVEPILKHSERISSWMAIRLSKVVLVMGSSAVQHLFRALASPFEDNQRFAADMLGDIGDIGAVSTLIETTVTDDLILLQKILVALGKLGDNRATSVLLQYLSHHYPEIRIAAARGLGYLGDPTTVKPLVRSVFNDVIDVRLEAGEALKRIGAEGKEALSEISRSRDETAAMVALQFLEELEVLEGNVVT